MSFIYFTMIKQFLNNVVGWLQRSLRDGPQNRQGNETGLSPWIPARSSQSGKPDCADCSSKVRARVSRKKWWQWTGWWHGLQDEPMVTVTCRDSIIVAIVSIVATKSFHYEHPQTWAKPKTNKQKVVETWKDKATNASLDFQLPQSWSWGHWWGGSKNHTPKLFERITGEIKRQINEVLCEITEDIIKQVMEILKWSESWQKTLIKSQLSQTKGNKTWTSNLAKTQSPWRGSKEKSGRLKIILKIWTAEVSSVKTEYIGILSETS